MIIRNIKKFNKIFRTVKLTTEEKIVMRTAMLNFIRQTPAVKNQSVGRLVFWQDLLHNLTETKLVATALMTILVLMMGGGTSLAAERAVPGDLLYPVKISVNEKIRSVVNFSDESKIEWEIDKVERRLEEAEKLKVKNQLDDSNGLTIKNQINQQTQVAAKLADKFEDFEKSSSANSRLEAVLRGHAQVLLALSEEDDGAAEIILDILDDTRAVSENRVEAEDKISTETENHFELAAKNKMKAAKNKIDEVKKVVNNNFLSLNDFVKMQVNAQLDSALLAYGAGKNNLDQKLYNEAFINFQAALRLAQEAQVIVRGAKRLEINWKNSIDESPNNIQLEVDQEGMQQEDVSESGEDKKFPVHLDDLINAAEKINNRTRSEIRDDDRSGRDENDRDNEKFEMTDED